MEVTRSLPPSSLFNPFNAIMKLNVHWYRLHLCNTSLCSSAYTSQRCDSALLPRFVWVYLSQAVNRVLAFVVKTEAENSTPEYDCSLFPRQTASQSLNYLNYDIWEESPLHTVVFGFCDTRESTPLFCVFAFAVPALFSLFQRF